METKQRKLFWIAKAFEDGEQCEYCAMSNIVEGGYRGESFRECDILEGKTKDMDCEGYVPHTVFVERADDTTLTFDCLAVNEEHAMEQYDAQNTDKRSDDFVCAEAV